MKQWWQQLPERDQCILILGTVIALPLSIYFFMVNPLNNQIEKLSAKQTYQNALISWMQQAKNRVKPSPSKAQTTLRVAPEQLLSTINRSLKNNLDSATYTLKQSASGKIQISFKQVPFNNVLKWLVKISQRYAINIEQFTAQSLSKPGLVKLQLSIN